MLLTTLDKNLLKIEEHVIHNKAKERCAVHKFVGVIVLLSFLDNKDYEKRYHLSYNKIRYFFVASNYYMEADHS